MTLVMAYVVLVTAGIGACAAAIETALRPRSVSLRWTWVLALAVAPVATAFAFFAPLPIVEVPVAGVLSSVAMDTSAPLVSASLTGVAASDDMFRVTDATLPLAWLAGSLALFIALAVGQWRFRAERRRARQARIADHDVLVTRELGPAVAGVWKPVVFVPEWVTALDEASVRLLLAHEHEHVKERDTSLLLFGAVSAAAMPWNPVVWWMVRRLRQAVEQDCDARVLATYPGVRRYADLLLTAASRHGLGARLLAAHFGEEATDLLRRIEAMTSRNRMPWARISGTTLVAAALVAAACEAPRPDPVSPIAPKSNTVLEQEVPLVTRSAEFSKQLERCAGAAAEGCAINVIVLASDGKQLARYAGEIPVAHIPEGGVQKINVENAKCGSAECSLIWVTLKPDQSLMKAPAGSLESSKIRELEAVASEVRQLSNKLSRFSADSAAYFVERRKYEAIELPVRDTLRRPLLRSVPGGNASVEARASSDLPVPSVILRNRKLGNLVDAAPLVVVDGIMMTGSLNEIDPANIERIEVVKGAAAKSTYGARAEHGVIQITTKSRRRVP